MAEIFDTIPEAPPSIDRGKILSLDLIDNVNSFILSELNPDTNDLGWLGLFLKEYFDDIQTIETYLSASTNFRKTLEQLYLKYEKIDLHQNSINLLQKLKAYYELHTADLSTRKQTKFFDVDQIINRDKVDQIVQWILNWNPNRGVNNKVLDEIRNYQSQDLEIVTKLLSAFPVYEDVLTDIDLALLDVLNSGKHIGIVKKHITSLGMKEIESIKFSDTLSNAEKSNQYTELLKNVLINNQKIEISKITFVKLQKLLLINLKFSDKLVYREMDESSLEDELFNNILKLCHLDPKLRLNLAKEFENSLWDVNFGYLSKKDSTNYLEFYVEHSEPLVITEDQNNNLNELLLLTQIKEHCVVLPLEFVNLLNELGFEKSKLKMDSDDNQIREKFKQLTTPEKLEFCKQFYKKDIYFDGSRHVPNDIKNSVIDIFKSRFHTFNEQDYGRLCSPELDIKVKINMIFGGTNFINKVKIIAKNQIELCIPYTYMDIEGEMVIFYSLGTYEEIPSYFDIHCFERPISLYPTVFFRDKDNNLKIVLDHGWIVKTSFFREVRKKS